MNSKNMESLRDAILEAAETIKRMEEIKPLGTKEDPYMFIVSPEVYDLLRPYMDANDIVETACGYFKATKSSLLKEVDSKMDALYYNPHNFKKVKF